MITIMFKKLLGRREEEEQIVEEKKEEGHQIRTQATNDLISVQKDIAKIRTFNDKELAKIHKKLDNIITYNIAIATGGLKNDRTNRKAHK